MARDSRGAVQTNWSVALRVHNRPLAGPGIGPSTRSSRSAHFVALTVFNVWSSGVSCGAHTHPDRTLSIGAYRRHALARKLRVCGDSGFSSVWFIVNLGESDMRRGPKTSRRKYTRYKSALPGRFTNTHRRHRMVFRTPTARETREPAKPELMNRP